MVVMKIDATPDEIVSLVRAFGRLIPSDVGTPGFGVVTYTIEREDPTGDGILRTPIMTPEVAAAMNRLSASTRRFVLPEDVRLPSGGIKELGLYTIEIVFPGEKPAQVKMWVVPKQ
jgi:hypothetical protein